MRWATPLIVMIVLACGQTNDVTPHVTPTATSMPPIMVEITATPPSTPTPTTTPTPTPTPAPSTTLTPTATPTPDPKIAVVTEYGEKFIEHMKRDSQISSQLPGLLDEFDEIGLGVEAVDWERHRQSIEDEVWTLTVSWDSVQAPAGFEKHYDSTRKYLQLQLDWLHLLKDYEGARENPTKSIEILDKLSEVNEALNRAFDEAITLSEPLGEMASSISDVPNEFGDGVHEVGVDIMPGTYRTTNPGDSCYWARLSDFSGEGHSIIANANVVGPAIVTIEFTDRGFESKRCGTWVRVGN